MKTLWEKFTNWEYTKEQLNIYSKEELVDMYIILQGKHADVNKAFDDMAYDFAKKNQLLLLNQARNERLTEETLNDFIKFERAKTKN